MSSKEIRENYRLNDGGVVPTLKEVFDLVKEKVPLTIELKVFEKNYKALSSKVIEFMKREVKDKSNYLLISFDPRSLWPLKKLGIIRSLLVAKSDEYTFTYFRHTVESVDVEQILLDEKRVRRYAKKHFTNVWTIQEEVQLDKVLPYIDTVTFQHLNHNLVKSKLEKKN